MFKNKLKMDYRCKYKTRKYKTLRVKHRYNHQKISHGKILYDQLSRENEIKILKKWKLIKLHSFCTMKETIIKMNMYPSELGETNSN